MDDFIHISNLIKNANFFSKAGVFENLGDDVVVIENLEKAFLEQNDDDFLGLVHEMTLLPSSINEIDVFYGNINISKELKGKRVELSKLVFQKNSLLDKKMFLVQNHDFSHVFKHSSAYAFRAWLSERYLGLGNHWERVANLYLKGHFPFAFCGKKIFVV